MNAEAASGRGARWREVLRGPFPAFVLLYALLYGAYGAESPFLPAFLAERGLSSGELGIALAAGTLVRIAAGPLAGHLADRSGAPRAVLGACALASGLVVLAYLAGHGFGPLVAVSMAHAVAIAPLAPLADAIALGAAARAGGRGFSYGWVRGVGSGAFILATLASGELVARRGLDSIIVTSGALFVAMAAATFLVPGRSAAGTPAVGGTAEADPVMPGGSGPDASRSAGAPAARSDARAEATSVRDLLALAAFRRLLLVAGLVIGSHALNDAFAVIRWREAGIPAGIAGLLWSESVAAEVVVFLFVGEPLLRRLGAARAAMLAAAAGIARWAAMALTAEVAVLALTQLLHGLTFALLHLAAMRVIARGVPEGLAATAQTVYGTFALGAASAALTAASGWLYAGLGAGAFWAMAALCLAAMPLAAGLREGDEAPRRPRVG